MGNQDNSYITNCLIIRRQDNSSDVLFSDNGDGSVNVYLNGYAIVPVEKYMELGGADKNGKWLQDIKNMDEQIQQNGHI